MACLDINGVEKSCSIYDVFFITMKVNKVTLWVMRRTPIHKYQHTEVTFHGTLKMGAGHLHRTLVPTYQTLSDYDSQDHDVNSGSNTAE